MGTNNNKNMPPFEPKSNKSATIVGAIIVLFGTLLLMKNLNSGIFFPSWFFGPPMIILIIGLVIGVNSKFEKKSSWVLIIIGGAMLFREWFDFSPSKIIFPALAIGLGVYLINRNRKAPEFPHHPPHEPPTDRPPHPTDEFDWDKRVDSYTTPSDTGYQQQSDQNNTKYGHSGQYANSTYFAENYLKVDSIFGSAKKVVLTKNFLGGTITSVFGSTEINLLQADLNQPVVIDVFQLLGSTKIIVPPHWTVSTSVSSILSENDDRRVIINHPFDENKKLFITGTSILGNIAIKNS